MDRTEVSRRTATARIVPALVFLLLPGAPASSEPPPNIADAKAALRAYHDSGEYQRDIATVIDTAGRWIAARAPLGLSDGVTRLRGRRLAYHAERLPEPIPALVMFHPAYLLRQPLQKPFAWRDLLTIQSWLESHDLPATT